MTTIRIENVWKEYGDSVVLERINLSLEDHEFLVIIGPSGVGKTTLLRMLLGQEMPTRGHIFIDDQPIAQEPTADRGVVFQRYSVFPHRTVLGNVMMGPQWAASPLLGRLFGARRRALRERAMALLERVGLAASADKYPAQLSRRHAAAPRHRAGAHHAPEGAVARRAVRRARSRHPPLHARIGARAVGGEPDDHRHGHPRSPRGVPARHPRSSPSTASAMTRRRPSASAPPSLPTSKPNAGLCANPAASKPPAPRARTLALVSNNPMPMVASAAPGSREGLKT